MNQIPNIEEEKTRCSCGRLVASPFSETVCSSFPFCQEEVGTFPNDPTGLRREFAIKFHRGDFIKDGEDNSELISDWFHQQLQKAREEESSNIIADYMEALGTVQLPKEVWLWIADINGKYLNKTLKENI